MSDSMNLMEKNSDFKLWKQNILRYIGFELATYKNSSLARPAELGSDKLPILLSLPANEKRFKISILVTLFSESC